MRRKICFTIILFLFVIVLHAQAGGAITREEYINTYAEIAMKEMSRTGIPASITLAQGCLESDNGNSTLAMKANNHFGIKCHDWEGARMHHDDDARKECFRKYRSPYESYQDHSEFLLTKPRYAFLFEYNPDDYRKWAKGLKQAGYATSPQYADLLIRIIEENELYRYDQFVIAGGDFAPGETAAAGRQIHTRNRIEYVVAEAGDTPESLRNEMDLYKNELYRYNDLDKTTKIEPGMVIYLQPKRRKAEKGNSVHIVREGETMYDISQEYGVKMKYLYRRNRIEEGDYITPGSEIYLRRRKSEPVLKLEPVEDSTDQEMIFEFEE